MKLLLLFLALSFSISSFASVKVLSLKGKVLYDGKPIKKNDVLEVGKVIDASAKKSYVDLAFPGGHQIRLKAGKMKLENLSKEKSIIEILSGIVFGNFRKFKKDSAKVFKIKTRTAVAGVRGTQFLIHEQDGKTYFCVIEGALKVESKGQSHDLPQGMDIFAYADKGLEPPSKGSLQMLNMVADEVEKMGFPTSRFWQKK